VESQIDPKKILSLVGVKISNIACGGAHTIAVSTDDTVYSCRLHTFHIYILDAYM